MADTSESPRLSVVEREELAKLVAEGAVPFEDLPAEALTLLAEAPDDEVAKLPPDFQLLAYRARNLKLKITIQGREASLDEAKSEVRNAQEATERMRAGRDHERREREAEARLYSSTIKAQGQRAEELEAALRQERARHGGSYTNDGDEFYGEGEENEEDGFEDDQDDNDNNGPPGAGTPKTPKASGYPTGTPTPFPAIHTRKEVEPATLKVTDVASWKAFPRNFVVTTELNRWNDRTSVLKLQWALREEAAALTEHLNFSASMTIAEALQEVEDLIIHPSASDLAEAIFEKAQRKGEESLQQWHSRLRSLHHRAYPKAVDFKPLHKRFIHGLSNTTMIQQLLATPGIRAFDYAQILHRAQDIQASISTAREATRVRNSVNALGVSTPEKPPVSAQGSRRPRGPCYNCREFGHLRADCPKPIRPSGPQKKPQKGKGPSNPSKPGKPMHSGPSVQELVNPGPGDEMEMDIDFSGNE